MPTILDQLLFTLKLLFIFATKQATLMRRSTVLSLPLRLVFPGVIYMCAFEIVREKVHACVFVCVWGGGEKCIKNCMCVCV